MSQFRIEFVKPAIVVKSDPVRAELDELNEMIVYYRQTLTEVTQPGLRDTVKNWLDHCEKRQAELIEGSMR